MPKRYNRFLAIWIRDEQVSIHHVNLHIRRFSEYLNLSNAEKLKGYWRRWRRRTGIPAGFFDNEIEFHHWGYINYVISQPSNESRNSEDIEFPSDWSSDEFSAPDSDSDFVPSESEEESDEIVERFDPRQEVLVDSEEEASSDEVEVLRVQPPPEVHQQLGLPVQPAAAPPAEQEIVQVINLEEDLPIDNIVQPLQRAEITDDEDALFDSDESSTSS